MFVVNTISKVLGDSLYLIYTIKQSFANSFYIMSVFSFINGRPFPSDKHLQKLRSDSQEKNYKSNYYKIIHVNCVYTAASSQYIL